MLLGNLGASLLGNLLTGKGVIATSKGRKANMPGQGTIRAAEDTIKAAQDLMLPRRLKNFEIQKYYQNGPKFNGACSGNNLPKITDGAHIIYLDKYESIGTHWITLYINANNMV